MRSPIAFIATVTLLGCGDSVSPTEAGDGNGEQPPTVASVAVTPPSSTFPFGTTAQLTWTARPQVSSVEGYDIFRATVPAVSVDPTPLLTCLQSNLPQVAIGSTITVPDDAALPPPDQIFYYYIGHSGRAAGALDAIGRRSDGTIRVAPVACP